MKRSQDLQIKTKENRRRRIAEHWRRLVEELRRRLIQAECDRRRKRLLLLLLIWLLESIPVQAFFPVQFATPDPAEKKRQPQPEKESAEARTDDERRYLYDYAPRRGEESQEVFDGLAYADIVALNKIHRPWHSPTFEPIPEMPKRYVGEPPHIWQLLDHIGSDYHRKDAIAALKLLVDPSAHDWIDACVTEVGGLTWKDLRRQCRRRTPNGTLHEFPRAALRWREGQRREEEQRKKDNKETPENGPRPPEID